MRALITVATVLLLMVSPVQARMVVASWYDCVQAYECKPNKIMANGKKFNPNALTVAHKTLPLGTRLKLTRGGKVIYVTVTDRGPFVKGRTLDLSKAAAAALGCIKVGVCKLDMQIIK